MHPTGHPLEGFENRDPLKGDGNQLIRILYAIPNQTRHFENRDPLKGDGNTPLAGVESIAILASLKTETRLKGMETHAPCT